MEGWQLRRRVARFRGIEILFLGAARSGGRRLDVHEFANRDIPYSEDLGRAARRFTLRGAVIGPDHDLEAERLEAALEKRGPGELVLPHRAPISVAVVSWRFEEPEREARIQNFEIEFVEAGLASTPAARENTAGIVEARADASLASLASRFASVFSIQGQTAAAIDRVVGLATSAADGISRAFELLKAGEAAGEEIAAYAREIDAFKRRISGSIVDAAVTAATFQDRLDDLLSLPLAPLAIYRRVEDVARFGVDLVDPGTGTVARRSFKRNQDALVALVQHSATTVRARALSRITFESSTEAAVFRDEIARELAAAIVSASDALADEAVAGLRALRTATIRDLDARSARLPARVTWSVPYQLPSVVIAQRLYGDPAREGEIVARNRSLIRNPGRIPFGTALEVLADG